MILDLRKGSTIIEYWHQFGADHIQAVKTQVELKGDVAIIRSTLKPSNGNQKNDADSYIKGVGNQVSKFIIKDKYIHERLAEFIKYRKDEIKSFELELLYPHAYKFSVKLSSSNHSDLVFDIKA